MNPKVDAFMSRAKKWQEEMEKMRLIALECNLTEEFKWGNPCYTLEGNNVVLIHAFKDYCAYLFFKGVLMKNDHGILVQQTDNVQASRQIRFSNIQEIYEKETVLKKYILNAIEVEKSGVAVPMKKTAEFKVAPEFETALREMPELKTAFNSLTPGRQRAYLLYFDQAKQSSTRLSRIEKNIQRILEGKGLND